MTREVIYAVSAMLGSGFSRRDLLNAIKAYFPDVNAQSILPSDYLVADAVKEDPSNDGNRDNYTTYPRFLRRLARNSYAFVG
jgi:hypothetical protein